MIALSICNKLSPNNILHKFSKLVLCNPIVQICREIQIYSYLHFNPSYLTSFDKNLNVLTIIFDCPLRDCHMAALSLSVRVFSSIMVVAAFRFISKAILQMGLC